uniref:Uncharacterized protein n=1 Tax=Arundo donax TaxID=35708 RepID=A0A0A9BY81_ARUDO
MTPHPPATASVSASGRWPTPGSRTCSSGLPTRVDLAVRGAILSPGFRMLKPWRPTATPSSCALLSPRVSSVPPMSSSFFVYRASPLPLTRLPTCKHEFINRSVRSNIGIMCREDGEFVVAHLKVTRKEADFLKPRDCPVTAELCCMLSKGALMAHYQVPANPPR